jgi:cell division protein FtsI/penicillin-binding protein 2
LEEKFDTTLRGNRNLLDELLHRPQIGLPITTAIDIKIQQRLARTMTGQKGAAILLDLQTGEVLAMVSSPTFDPISLEQNWDELKKDTDAPLLNRVTQGLYQPGPLIQHIHSSSSLLPPNDPYNLGAPVSFELKNEFVPYPVAATYSETIGQGQLRLTPLRVATAFAEISIGERITPTLMLSEQVVQNKRFKPIAPITVFAKSSEKEFIGWRVQTFENYLLVIALEQTNHSTHKLDEITSTLVPN